MLDTKWSWITQKQLQKLENSFKQNKDAYYSDIQAQKKEIKSVMILISILPILLLIFFIIDIISNERNILEVLSENFIFTIILLLGYIWIFMLVSWWLINSRKTKYNKTSLFNIFHDFIRSSLNSHVSQGNDEHFYNLASSKWIINEIPQNIQTHLYQIWELKLQSDNVFTQTSSWRSVTTVDNCYLWKIQFPKTIINTPFTVTENTTNNPIWIIKRILSALQYWFIIVWLYYIFWVEKCESKIIGDGCKNDINLLWFFDAKYITLALVITLIIFSFWYIQTLRKKSYISNSSIDDNFDIFTYWWQLDDSHSTFLSKIKWIIESQKEIWKNFKFYIWEDTLLMSAEKRSNVYDKNILKSLHKTLRSWFSKKTAEQSLTRENINYLNFNTILQNLGKEIQTNI